MKPTQILILLALTIYALYRQSIRHEVTGHSRFKLAWIYGIVGLVVGGFYVPVSTASWAILVGSIALSAVVGVARGKLTRLWVEPDGRVFSQGTALTITLFLLLVGSKWIIGAVQYLSGQQGGGNSAEHGGFGEILVLIAIMVALQAEIIWRRARVLKPGFGDTPPPLPSNA